MRAYLETWLIGDGQVPDFGVGDVLRDVVLCLSGRERTASSGSDLVAEWHESVGQESTELVQIDGTVEWLSRDPELALIRSQDVLFMAEGHWNEAGEPTDPIFVQTPLRIPPRGHRTRVVGRLSFAPDHRREELPRGETANPGLHTDWAVRQIEHVDLGGGPPTPVQRADGSGDIRGGIYLVELERSL